MDKSYEAKKFCISYLNKLPWSPKVIAFNHCRLLVRVDDHSRRLWFDFYVDVLEFHREPNHPGEFYLWCKNHFDQMEEAIKIGVIKSGTVQA